MIDVNLLFTNNATVMEPTPVTDFSSMIPAIEASCRIHSQSSFIIDFDEHKLLFRSEQLLYLDEASVRDIRRECANPYWSLISEETLEQLAVIHRSYPEVYGFLSREEFEKHICVIDYPISLRNHQMYITQKFTPLQMRSDGITKVGLFSICHSNKVSIESSIITPSGRRFRFDFKDEEYKEYDLDMTLTIVERAILHRARMGMNTEEIAKNLYLSVNTVKTHKQRIFKKLHVNTINEAITVIGNYMLL